MKDRDAEKDIWSWEWFMLALSGLFALFMALVLLFVFWQYQMNKGLFSLPSFSGQEKAMADEEKYRLLAELHSTSTEEVSLEERIAILQALSDPSEKSEMIGEGEIDVSSGEGGAENESGSALSQEEKMQILERLGK